MIVNWKKVFTDYDYVNQIYDELLEFHTKIESNKKLDKESKERILDQVNDLYGTFTSIVEDLDDDVIAEKVLIPMIMKEMKGNLTKNKI